MIIITMIIITIIILSLRQPWAQRVLAMGKYRKDLHLYENIAYTRIHEMGKYTTKFLRNVINISRYIHVA